MNSSNLKELLGELLIETYTRTVDDNKEDFSWWEHHSQQAGWGFGLQSHLSVIYSE